MEAPVLKTAGENQCGLLDGTDRPHLEGDTGWQARVHPPVYHDAAHTSAVISHLSDLRPNPHFPS